MSEQVREVRAKRSVSRRGLTLLELVVVLTIIVAVGGIVVAMLPNFLHRSNIASCTANIPELDKLIQTHKTLYAEYPNRYDSLVESDGSLFSGLVVDETGVAQGITAAPITPEEAAALEEAGITELFEMADKTAGAGNPEWHVTFGPYAADPPVATAVSSFDQLAVLTPGAVSHLGMPSAAGNKYVAFGMNKHCSMFRNLAAEAPIHFADSDAEDPDTYYMCFGAIFMVGKDDGTGGTEALEEARFMGSFAFHDFGPSSTTDHVKEWWGRLDDERPLE